MMKAYLSVIIILCSLFILGCSSVKVTTGEADDFEIYLLMGQSNMAGRGILSDSLRDLHDDRVWMLTMDLNWVMAKHPIHFDKPAIAGVGPGLSFGITMAKSHPGIKIGLVPCAVGGTSIDKWHPGAFDPATSTHPYDDAVARITEAMKKGKVKGILWLQGEADSNKDKAPVYLDELKVVVKKIRKLTGERKLPVVVGELGRYNPKYQIINNELHKAPLRIKNLEVVSSEGLTDKGDNIHFDAKSADIYGERFAMKMLELQNRDKQPVVCKFMTDSK